MDFPHIISYVCAKVGQVDSYAQARCLDFTKSNARMIYEAFDWKAAQGLAEAQVEPDPTTTQIDVPEFHHVLSVRVDGELLDPVTTSFVFESSGEDYSTPATKARYYDEFYDPASSTRSIKLYPPLDGTNGNRYSVVVLGKKQYDENLATVAIPQTENALIAYVQADMYEWLRQVGKAQAKRADGDKLLETAKAADSPPAARSRQSKALTVSGNSLAELTDSVCDIIGKWEPDTRISVQERIRRNYQNVWEAAIWPESTVMARIQVTDNEQLILPHYFDRFLQARTDTNPDENLNYTTTLQMTDLTLFFGVDKDVFERNGEPVRCAMLSPVGVSVLPPFNEQLLFVLFGSQSGGVLTRYPHGVTEKISVFVKGETGGTETSESLEVNTVPPGPGPTPENPANLPNAVATTYSYDTPLTVAKSVGQNTLYVYGAKSGKLLLTLPGGERERKHLRIWLLPSKGEVGAQLSSSVSSTIKTKTVLVLGKRKMSPLVADQDTCQLRNIENVLINASAADMLVKLGQSDHATIYKTKSESALQVLIDGETKQNAYQPTIVPYTENYYCESDFGWTK